MRPENADLTQFGDHATGTEHFGAQGIRYFRSVNIAQMLHPFGNAITAYGIGCPTVRVSVPSSTLADSLEVLLSHGGRCISAAGALSNRSNLDPFQVSL